MLPPQSNESLNKRWSALCEHLGLDEPKGMWRSSARLSSLVEGWKVHLAATVLSACDLLERVTDELAASEMPFKVAADLGTIYRLNAALDSPYSQIGKVITIYAGADGDTVRALCNRLAELVGGLAYPRIPSDRHFKNSVFYRWGSYRSATLKGPHGPVPDERRNETAVPTWVQPFDTAQRGAHIPALRDTPYRIRQPFIVRGKGGVFECVDIRTGELVVLKHGRAAGEVDFQGRDGYQRLKREELIISDLGASGVIVPQVCGSFHVRGDYFLVLEAINGLSADRLLRSAWYRELADGERARITVAVLEVVDSIHRAGYVWGDIKPSNFIVTTSKAVVRPIDFEGAIRVGDTMTPWASPGYLDPRWPHSKQLPARPEMDLYGLVVTCTQLLSGKRDPAPIAVLGARRRRSLAWREAADRVRDLEQRSSATNVWGET